MGDHIAFTSSSPKVPTGILLLHDWPVLYLPPRGAGARAACTECVTESSTAPANIREAALLPGAQPRSEAERSPWPLLTTAAAAEWKEEGSERGSGRGICWACCAGVVEEAVGPEHT